MALKEARKEIQHLQEVVESVRSNLREQDPHDHKPYSGLGPRPGGRSRSCGCSPASTLSRNTTYQRLSSEALQVEARPAGQTHLLLEAALLRGPPGVPRSSTCERLCSGGAVLPMSHSCHSLSSCRCAAHTYLPHHHLFLHLPQEEAPAAPATEPLPTRSPAAKRQAEVRSRACSPTMTWLCEEGGAEELSVVSLPRDTSPGVEPPAPAEPLTCQPQPAAPPAVRQEAVVVDDKEEAEGANRHWSRYFLVDLLALTVPVVPAVAWLCRGAPQEALPVYHIGSLLRGCCAVALHSLRRQAGGRGRRGPATTSGATSV